MDKITYEKLEDMEQILEVIINDIEVIIQIQNNFISRKLSKEACPEKDIEVADFNSVTFSFLFLTLHKYMEFYDKFKSQINKLVTDGQPKEIRTSLKSLKVKDYRDKFAAHIFDDDTKRPLTMEKQREFFNGITKAHKSVYAFWLKLDSYHFTQGAPLLTTLKEILSKVRAEYNNGGAAH